MTMWTQRQLVRTRAWLLVCVRVLAPYTVCLNVRRRVLVGGGRDGAAGLKNCLDSRGSELTEPLRCKLSIVLYLYSVRIHLTAW